MRELRGDTQTSVITTVETNNNVFVFECNVNVTIPNSVTIISDSAFLNCKKLENVQFMQFTDAKSSIKSIGNSAFQGCVALTSIRIPDSVETIGENAFNGCTALTSINYDDKNIKVTTISKSAFEGCSALTSIRITNLVTIISDSAFLNCKKLENVQFMQFTDAKSSIKSIGNSAFQGCVALTSIRIPDSVETIGENAFNGCTALTKVYIPISVANKLKIQKGNGIVFFGATVTVEYYYTD